MDSRVLLAYLASHLQDARVLYVGDVEDSAPFFESGVRLMQIYRHSPPLRPLEGAVLVQTLERGVDVAPGAFDLAIVDDLVRVRGRLELLANLQRAVGQRGFAVVVAQTGPNLEYTELYDACASLFEHVTMVGKLPFAGTLFCQLGLEEAPEVSVDTELAEHDAPTTLLAVLSQEPIALDAYAIVAHPADEGSTAEPPQPAEPDLGLRVELSQLTLQNQVLQGQLAEAKEQRAHGVALTGQLEAAARAAQQAESEAFRLREALRVAQEEQQTQLAAHKATREMLEARLEQALGAAHASTRELEAAHQRALESLRAELHATHQRTLESLRAELAAARAEQSDPAELENALAQLAAESERAEQAEAELLALRDQMTKMKSSREQELRHHEQLRAELAQVDRVRADEVQQLETTLRERGAHLVALEAELKRRERMVKQLLIAERFAAPSGGELESKLDQMAREVARHQGELEARGWRIQELEMTLASNAR